MLQYHVIIFVGMKIYIPLFLVAFTSHLECFCFFEENLRWLRIFRCDLGGNIIISKVDNPVEVVFGYIGILHEVAKLGDVAIHELFCAWFRLLFLIL